MAGAASKGKGRLALLYTGTTRSFHRSAQLVDLPVQVKRPLVMKIKSDIIRQADNIFITLDGTSLYNSTRKWAVKRHYHEDYN